jgi:PKD domain
MRHELLRLLPLAFPAAFALAAGPVAYEDEPLLSARSDPDPLYFEERIQPMYATNCGTSGCHGSPGSGRLVLERPDFQGRYSLEATEQNLKTTLQFVEFGKPMASRLLLKPLREKDGGLPHTGKQYDFKKESEEYQLFADWIRGAELTDVPPIADAGPEKSGKRGQEFTLDGTASRERRGGTLEYQWSIESKPPGSAPVLKRADTATPSLRADRDGSYTLSLVVSNGRMQSTPATTTIRVDSSPFVMLEAEDAAIERGFYSGSDGAASGLRMLAPAQDAKHDTLGRAELRFALPQGGAYRMFARATANESTDELRLGLDDAALIALEVPVGPGYRMIEVPLLQGDGELAGAGGRALGGGVAVREGVLVLRGDGSIPARFRLDGASPASLACELTWQEPEKGSISTQSFFVRLGAEHVKDGVFAGIDFGRGRYVVKRVDGDREKVLAEKRQPFRAGQAIRFALDRGGDSLFLTLPDGEVLTAKVGAEAGPVAEWVAIGDYALDHLATTSGDVTKTFEFDTAADPAGFAKAGEHRLVFEATGVAAPRIDQVFLMPRGEDGAAATSRSREIRALYLDLLGRTPTPMERMMAAALPRERLIEQLVASLEFEENLYQLELYFFLLLDNFHPRTPQLEALPSRLANDETDWRDAIREIVISQYFNARNPGNDTFVTVILEQLLGITVQDEVKLLEAGKRMYDGYKATVFGVNGASQSDLVGIVLAQPEFATRFVARHYERLVGAPPSKLELTDWADRFRADPRVYRTLVREWLDTAAYHEAVATSREKSDFMWIRGVFVDLLGRKPSFEEFRNFRNAVQALADSGPLRSVLAKVMLDSGQVALPGEQGLDAVVFVTELFERFLARAPRQDELALFVGALDESDVEPRTLVQAILSSVEYQRY